LVEMQPLSVPAIPPLEPHQPYVQVVTWWYGSPLGNSPTQVSVQPRCLPEPWL